MLFRQVTNYDPRCSQAGQPVFSAGQHNEYAQASSSQLGLVALRTYGP